MKQQEPDFKKDCNNQNKNSQLSDVKITYIKKNIQGKNILDVGAGRGYYSEWLATYNPALKIMAMDQLDISSKHNFEFIATNLEEGIPTESAHFSTVLAFDIIEHIANDKHFVRELWRVSQKDGVLIGSVPHDQDKFLPAYNLTFYHRSDLTHKRYYLPETLQKTLEAAGFAIVCIDKQGGVSPQVIAEFFPRWMQFFIKKCVGGLRRIGIIDSTVLSSDLFFVAKKKD